MTCKDCRYLKGGSCKLWEIKVKEPTDSYCESLSKPNNGIPH